MRTIKILLLIAAPLLLISFISDVSAKSVKKEKGYSVKVMAEEKLDEKILDSLEKELTNHWKGPIPKNNEFILTTTRLEDGWALFNLYFEQKGADYSQDGESPVANMFLMFSVQKNKKWESRLEDSDRDIDDLLALIPKKGFGKKEKDTLFKTKKPISYASAVTAVSVDYKYPWDKDGLKFTFSRYNVNNNGCYSNSSWHGKWAAWGTKACHALDFAPIPDGDKINDKIISPVNGTIHTVCKNVGDDQGLISIKATGTSDIIGLWHIQQDSIPNEIKPGIHISQGDYLGIMVQGFDDESTQGYSCRIRSEGTHLHMIVPVKPFYINSYKYKANNKVDYDDKTYTFAEFYGKTVYSTNEIGGSNNCQPPSSGTWNIYSNCILGGSDSILGNIIIHAPNTLTFNSDAEFNFNFKNKSIIIKPGARLMIRDGGNLY